MIRVFIGFDPRETIAYNVLSFSIQRHATQPVAIAPLMLSQLGGVLTRERHPLQSTDFSFSRFLTPFLADYTGWSVFMDCDMLMLDDIATLWSLRDERYAVMVVKHRHVPRETVKFLGEPQSKYKKKNWSSVMLFNNALCRTLTPDYVNTATGLELHQFKWLESEDLIGSLPDRGIISSVTTRRAPTRHSSITRWAGRTFEEFGKCEYADAWREAKQQMLRVSKSRA